MKDEKNLDIRLTSLEIKVELILRLLHQDNDGCTDVPVSNWVNDSEPRFGDMIVQVNHGLWQKHNPDGDDIKLKEVFGGIYLGNKKVRVAGPFPKDAINGDVQEALDSDIITNIILT